LRVLVYTAALVFERVTRAAGSTSRGRRPVQLLAIVGLFLLLGVLALGCGGGDDTTTDDDALPPNVVTQDDIDAQEDGSPGRALLEWWQAFQFGDSETVLDLTRNATLNQLGENNLTELVKNTGQGLQGLEVLSTEESGSTASVRVGLLTFQPEKEGEPPPDEPTSSTPDTFEMKKQGDQWTFAATEYLEPKLESYQQSQQQQEEQTTTGQDETTTTTGE
jgi:hypothetical protein